MSNENQFFNMANEDVTKGEKTDGPAKLRTFESGATRDLNQHKMDYSGFLSPIVLRRFAEYMHQHRFQKDNTIRDSNNWQRGLPIRSSFESLSRHFLETWLLVEGYPDVTDAEGRAIDIEEALCALLFNVQAILFEILLARNDYQRPIGLRPGQDIAAQTAQQKRKE